MASYVPPRDAYELQVAVTAGHVLGRSDVGALDDLVAFGCSGAASSELAERLAALVGRHVPIVQIAEARTVEAIAAACRAARKSDPWDSLVTIRPRRAGAALALVHPIGGNAFWYLDLCRKLDGEHGLYALHARGLDLDERPYQSIEEIAGAYAARLRDAVPGAPYMPAGWSFGGFVAFAMARRLAAWGEDVPLVVLFDVSPADRGAVPAVRGAAWGLLINALRLHRDALRLMALPEGARAAELLAAATRSRALPAGVGVDEVERLLELNLVHLAAMERHEPGPYGGDVLVFAAAERLANGDGTAPRGLGWEALTSGEVRVHALPGTHFDALGRANHDEIARRLRSELAAIAPAACSPRSRS